MKKLELQKIAGTYFVCHLGADEDVPLRLLSDPIYAIVRDEKETTIVLQRSNSHPIDGIVASEGEEWEMFRIRGMFSFDETGIVLSAVRPLSENGLGVFVLSTFSSDLLMVKQRDAEKAASCLKEAGHTIIFDKQTEQGIRG